jgi:hypothetical protein
MRKMRMIPEMAAIHPQEIVEASSPLLISREVPTMKLLMSSLTS